MSHDYDVAVTFAGEDRAFVEAVVAEVKAAGFTVFYDEDAKSEMWGVDLPEFFADIYERRARYAMMFVSVHYAAKPWTRLERRSVLARAMQASSPYLLPVRLDSTELPGVRSTIGYLDGLRETPTGVANALKAKLGVPATSGERKFNGRVPRTDTEFATMLGERPPAWEYIALAYWLREGVDARQDEFNDHRLRFALPTDTIAEESLITFAQSQQAQLLALTQSFEDLLLGPAQITAFGEPGVQGDPVLIKHLASRMIAVYQAFLDWSHRIRSTAARTEAGRELLYALAEYAAQPIEAIHAFVAEYNQNMDEISARLLAGENINLTMPIKFDISKAVSKRYHAALKAHARRNR
ncbi:TIR domain-containing protein [Microbacterium sp. C5A9]|uniref:toll/interleukin-1 receptor domain-containing protein n=1 Tax=Microbacterium sp. C5A9 TaxID=2736663 RepID=UPI001F52069A|nr:TIR domain-containing protein [Microbacterium sp. C5A9]MCI1019384.1 TIR domain-containing protein [Microbacterium sp. C5A9]